MKRFSVVGSDNSSCFEIVFSIETRIGTLSRAEAILIEKQFKMIGVVREESMIIWTVEIPFGTCFDPEMRKQVENACRRGLMGLVD